MWFRIVGGTIEVQQYWEERDHHLSGILYKKKRLKTSAVSTIDGMVETQLCKLRGTSDAFV